MRPGMLVEFSAGLFGIQPPENLGFVLERITRKKTIYLKLLTTKGVREIRAHQITKRKLNISVKLPKIPQKLIEKQLLPRLQDSIKKYGSSTSNIGQPISTNLKTSVQDQEIKPPSAEHDLWIKITRHIKKTDISFSEAFSTQKIATIWYEVQSPSLEQYSTMEEMLKKSLPSGVGYFESVGRNLWILIHPDDYSKILDQIKHLEKLRERLVDSEEYEDEDGYLQIRHIPIGIKYAGLSPEDEVLFVSVQNWMSDFVKYGKLGKGTGLAGTKTHEIDKFSLGLYLRFLAEDWTETRNILQPASAMTEFLFQTNFWSESEALEGLARRSIEQDATFSWEVDSKMEELARSFPEPAELPEVLAMRTDLTDLLAYTVDPEGARDFDQALSFEKTDSKYILWVHIADVSHYVARGSELDDYAKQRATAVYLPSRGLPMNPPALSTGLCALQANVIRLCLTAKLEFNYEGDRISSEIFEAFIKVRDNLTYDYVDEKLKEKDQYWTGMLELGNILRKRFKGLNVETIETRMSTQNPLLEVAVSEVSVSSEMNEMFMVAANEAVGIRIKESGYPGIFRCHPLPDKPDIEKFNDQMKALGLDVVVELPEGLESSAINLQTQNKIDTEPKEENIIDMLKSGGKLSLMGGGLISTKTKKKKKDESLQTSSELSEVKDTDETRSKKDNNKSILLRGLSVLSSEDQERWMKPFRDVLLHVRQVENPLIQKVMHLTVLGMFGRAYYTKDNIGHFGLGSSCYTHFTAPIRRYSDIIAHRILKSILRGTAIEKLEYTTEELEELTEYCSTQSQKAESIEFRVKGAGLVLMTRRPEYAGELSAVVVKVMARGIFLLINEIIEGRINMRELTRDEIIVDPSESIAFRKKRENAQIKHILTSTDWQDMLDDENEPIEVLVRLGQFIQVKIVARDYVEGKLELVPIH